MEIRRFYGRFWCEWYRGLGEMHQRRRRRRRRGRRVAVAGDVGGDDGDDPGQDRKWSEAA
eukprot:971500-Prymnesium_polylepis.2